MMTEERTVKRLKEWLANKREAVEKDLGEKKNGLLQEFPPEGKLRDIEEIEGLLNQDKSLDDIYSDLQNLSLSTFEKSLQAPKEEALLLKAEVVMLVRFELVLVGMTQSPTPRD